MPGKRGRPPKSLTLDPLKGKSGGESLPDVRSPASQREESVLQSAPPGKAPRDEAVGVFAADEGTNRGGGSEPREVSGDPDIRLSILIRRVLAEHAADEFQDLDGVRMTNAEKLARILVNKAIADENQFAIEAVLDRAEGKPVKGQQVQMPDMTVEEMISQQEVALLNNLNKSDKK